MVPSPETAAMNADLRIVDLELDHFRSYSRYELHGIGALTVFVGPNAIGKTNIVEAIQLVTALASFRSSRLDEMVQWGQASAAVRAHMVSDVRDLDVRADLRPGHKGYSLNGKKKAAQDLQGLLPSVVFSPEDLALVKGAHAGRRAALDLLGCQLSKNHRIIKRDYEKLLRHKNSLLKDDVSGPLLESVNDMLALTGSQLYRYRSALFAQLRTRVPEIYARLVDNGETVDLVYVPSWESDEVKSLAASTPLELPYVVEQARELLESAMRSRAAEEAARHRGVVGPHADHVEVFIDGRNAGTFGSQGQQRSIVLAWKIAEVELIRSVLGVKPVLLLDDVMSELDERRRHALVNLLLQDIQTFITTTDASFFDREIMDRAQVHDLSER